MEIEIFDTVEQKKSRQYAVKGASSLELSVKDVDTVGRTVTGFFGTFNYFDSDSDVLLIGSAKKSIQERGPKSNATAKIKHALFHDLTQLPGKILTLEEREVDGIKGIYFESKMSDTTLGNDTLKNYLEKIYDNHSIGFQYLDVEHIDKAAKGWDKAVQSLVNPDEANKAGYMFLIKEIRLFEGSTVAFGANKLTPYLGVKSGNKDSMLLALQAKTSQLKQTLKSGTQSDEMMQTFELQLLQINQMIGEIINGVPFGKSSEKQDERQNEIKVEPAVNYKSLTDKLIF